MGVKTKIQWCESTWNPIKAALPDGKVGFHCELVSAECQNCYAQTYNQRNLPNCGTGLPYTRSSRDKVDIIVDAKHINDPVKWQKPRVIFVCSMTDLFGEFVSFEQIDEVLAVISSEKRHTFQLLTKRPERALEYIESRGITALPDNVWFGVTAGTQDSANKRVPLLLRLPVGIRFVSAEPLLEYVDLTSLPYGDWTIDALAGYWTMGAQCGVDSFEMERCEQGPAISQVIFGGESGPKSRGCNIKHIRDGVRQCQTVGTAAFVKQLGAKPYYCDEGHDGGAANYGRTVSCYGDVCGKYKLKDKKGGDIEEFPKDLQVREMPA